MRVQRRINQTHRKRIPRDKVRIALEENGVGAPPAFNAHLDLNGLDLPGTAEVFVEAYHKTTTQRFRFGTIAEPSEPEYKTLDEIDLGGQILFRVKVVANEGRAGRLLASAEQIAPQDIGDDPNRDFLISVKACDLGEQVWDLDLNTDGYTKPVLKINFRVPDALNTVRHNGLFQALILPAIVREVYTFIFWDCELNYSDESWQRMWLDFGQRLSGDPPPESEDPADFRGWLDVVSGYFANMHTLNSRLVFAMTGAD